MSAAGAAQPATESAAMLPDQRSAGVEVRGISKTFTSKSGEVTALMDVSLEVESGRFAALVGPSGCGKSTLLRIAAGLYPPSAGAIRIGDEPVERPRRDVGLVFQSPNLLPWRTVEQNVALPLEIGGRSSRDGRERIEQFLRTVGLYEFRKKLPAELSGGMQQRAGIVRALVHDPAVLLMDEPFGAVDVLTRDRLNFEIQALWEETRKTILFVTHSTAEAVLLSDEVYVFSPRPGTILERVPIDLQRPRTREMMRTSGFFALDDHIRGLVRDA